MASAAPSTCPRCNRPVEPAMNVCPSCGQPLTTYPHAAASSPHQPTNNTPAAASARMNVLIIPLVIVSLLALAEAAIIIMLLVSSSMQSATRTTTPVANLQQNGGATPTVAVQGGVQPEVTQEPGTDLPRGKVGERVDSAGFAITVVDVYHEPDPGLEGILDLREDQQYLAIDVVLENETGSSFFFGSASFRLKDSDGFEYSESLDYREPALNFGTLTHGERVRGFLSFVLPSDVQGLSLIYQNSGIPNYQTIYIDLGQ